MTIHVCRLRPGFDPRSKPVLADRCPAGNRTRECLCQESIKTAAEPTATQGCVRMSSRLRHARRMEALTACTFAQTGDPDRTERSGKEIEFRVLTQSIDTGTPERRIFFHMTAAFDQFQREQIVENTKAGLAAARSSGRKGGRPRAKDDEKVRLAETMLRDTMNYPSDNDVIKQLKIGRTALCRHLSTEKIRNSGHNTPEMSAIHAARSCRYLQDSPRCSCKCKWSRSSWTSRAEIFLGQRL